MDLMTHLKEFTGSAAFHRVTGQPDLTFKAGLSSDVFVDLAHFAIALLCFIP